MAIYEEVFFEDSEELKCYLTTKTNQGFIIFALIMHRQQLSDEQRKLIKILEREASSPRILIAAMDGEIIGRGGIDIVCERQYTYPFYCLSDIPSIGQKYSDIEMEQAGWEEKTEPSPYRIIKERTHEMDYEKYGGWIKGLPNFSSEYQLYTNAFLSGLLIIRKSQSGQIVKLPIDGAIFAKLIEVLPTEFFFNSEAARIIYRAICDEIAFADWMNIRPTIFWDYWQPALERARKANEKALLLEKCRDDEAAKTGKASKAISPPENN